MPETLYMHMYLSIAVEVYIFLRTESYDNGICIRKYVLHVVALCWVKYTVTCDEICSTNQVKLIMCQKIHTLD